MHVCVYGSVHRVRPSSYECLEKEADVGLTLVCVSVEETEGGTG